MISTGPAIQASGGAPRNTAPPAQGRVETSGISSGRGPNIATDPAHAGPAVDPEIDQAVERGIVEEAASTSKTASRPRPQAPATRGAGAQARENFGDVRDGYAGDLNVPPGGQVHHGVELQVLDKYPGVYAESELNAPANMRGIPPENAGLRQLHNSKIREILDRHYRALDSELATRRLAPGTPEYNSLVRSWLTDASREVDWALSQFFSENR
jgi:hypothetical protein